MIQIALIKLLGQPKINFKTVISIKNLCIKKYKFKIGPVHISTTIKENLEQS